MSVVSDAGQEPGDLMRRLRELEQEVAELRTARRLESAAIGAGGLRVKDGGRIEILDENGDVALELAAEGLTLQGLLEVAGRFDWRDATGALRMRLTARGEDDSTNVAIITYFPTGGRASAILGTQLQGGQPSRHGLTLFYEDTYPANVLRMGDPQNPDSGVFTVQYDDSTSAVNVVGKGANKRVTLTAPDGETLLWIDEDGLRRPRQSVHWTTGWFGNMVDSAGYEATAEAWVHHTYPQMRMQYRVVRSGTPTVQVRVRDMAQDATVAGPFTHADSGRSTIDVVLPTSLHQSRRYELQAQISGGSGSARVDVTRCDVGGFSDFSPS